MVYDAAVQLVGRRYPDGHRHTFSYDAVGNRTLMADLTGRTTTVYDPWNNPTSVTDPDSKTVGYGYDAVGR
jgi:YD repeat-containing protein